MESVSRRELELFIVRSLGELRRSETELEYRRNRLRNGPDRAAFHHAVQDLRARADELDKLIETLDTSRCETVPLSAA